MPSSTVNFTRKRVQAFVIRIWNNNARIQALSIIILPDYLINSEQTHAVEDKCNLKNLVVWSSIYGLENVINILWISVLVDKRRKAKSVFGTTTGNLQRCGVSFYCLGKNRVNLSNIHCDFRGLFITSLVFP